MTPTQFEYSCFFYRLPTFKKEHHIQQVNLPGTSCFDESELMHDLVIGLFINFMNLGHQSSTLLTPLQQLQILQIR